MNGKMNMFQLGALHKNCPHQPRTLLLSSAAARTMMKASPMPRICWSHFNATCILCICQLFVIFWNDQTTCQLSKEFASYGQLSFFVSGHVRSDCLSLTNDLRHAPAEQAHEPQCLCCFTCQGEDAVDHAE